MLNMLRNAAKTWVFKGLFAILVISFAVWGIGDISLGGAGDRVASVGNARITVQDFALAFQRELQSLSNRAGRRITVDEAQELGVDQILLARLTRDAALNEEAKALGLSASDEAVRDAILESPSFSGLDGKFDEQQYRFVLQQLGIPVDKFERDQRRAIAREQAALGVAGGAKAPSNMAKAMLTYRLEKRKFVYLTLDREAHAEDPGAPDEAALKAQYEATPEAYTLPETRAVTYVAIEPAGLTGQIEVSEEDLRAAYDEQAERFNIPERRVVDQLVFPSEEAARAALALIEAGQQDFAGAARELNLSLDDVNLGEVTRDDLPAAAAEAAFAAEIGVTGPVTTGFGPALLNVRAILPGKVTPFEEAREELREEVALLEAGERAAELAESAEDLLASGASLSAIADELRLPLMTEAAARRDGEGLSGVAASAEFLAEAFEAGIGEERDIVDLPGGGYLLLRVDGVTEAALQPLDAVRAEVEADWRAARRSESVLARAEEAAEKLDAGAEFAEIASGFGVIPTESGEIARGMGVARLPSALVETMFALEPGKAAAGETPTGAAVAKLVEVIPADLASEENARLLEVWTEALDSSVGQDLYAYYGIAVQDRAGATVNPEALDRVLNSFR